MLRVVLTFSEKYRLRTEMDKYYTPRDEDGFTSYRDENDTDRSVYEKLKISTGIDKLTLGHVTSMRSAEFGKLRERHNEGTRIAKIEREVGEMSAQLFEAAKEIETLKKRLDLISVIHRGAGNE